MENKRFKKGISLIVLVITIIVIIILAAAVILTLTDNNPISNAKQAAFLNDLDTFKSELDMYKTQQYATTQGDYEAIKLFANENSLTYDGIIYDDKSIKSVITSLRGISKYQGKFAIDEGKLVYAGKESKNIGWAAEVGVEEFIPEKPKLTLSVPPVETIVDKGTDIVYTIQAASNLGITTNTISSDKIKLINDLGEIVPLASENIIVGELTGTIAKKFTVRIKTNSLAYDSYKIRIEEETVENSENLTNISTIIVPGFEIADNVPPLNPVLTVTPTSVTNGNVTVTIDYKDADEKLYSLDNGTTWLTYTSAILVTENNKTILVKGKDNAGNETSAISTTIANIDKTLPQDVTFNLTAANSTISGTILLQDNESGINLSQSKYIITNTITPYLTNATEWNAATVITENLQNISVTKTNGNYYVQVLSTDLAGNKKVNVSGILALQDYVVTTADDPQWYRYTNMSTGEAAQVNTPKLAPGMTPIKYPSELGNTARWANAITQDGSMWVWIPRYEYKIPTPHSSTAQTIDVNFIQGIGTTPTSGYIMHPAFSFDMELTGIWIAKFKASGSGVINILPNITNPTSTMWIVPIFNLCRNMETVNGTQYGWGTTGIGIDTHLIKNVEWGAMAYLSSSVYGKIGRITNGHNTLNGGTYATNIATSTTGNIYGIYDASGGGAEYTSAYVSNGNSNLYAYGGYSFLNAAGKYKDAYSWTYNTDKLNGATSYSLASTTKGDAVYETSTAGTTGSTSWYSGYSQMPYAQYPFFRRSYGNSIFAFANEPGASTDCCFRPVLAVETGL